MGSQLKNLMHWKTLTWNNFGAPVNRPAPKPGKMASGAYTYVRWKFTAAPKPEVIPGKKLIRLKDAVVVTIELDKAKSWVAAWVFKQPKTFQDELLDHERVHYEICALVARDAFIEIMQLKSKQYGSSAKLGADINKIINRHHNDKVIDPIHKKYDAKAESDHGRNRPGQKRWDGYFNKAFTVARTPQQKAPDGVLYKVPFLDVLKAAGKV